MRASPHQSNATRLAERGTAAGGSLSGCELDDEERHHLRAGWTCGRRARRPAHRRQRGPDGALRGRRGSLRIVFSFCMYSGYIVSAPPSAASGGTP